MGIKVRLRRRLGIGSGLELGLGLGLALGLGPHDVEGVLGGCGMLWHSVGRVRRIVAWCWECHNVP